MTYTDKAKKWYKTFTDDGVDPLTPWGYVLAFAKYLDSREPRKEDKPVCEKCGCSDCPFVRIRERMIEKCQPKPEPIEELYKDRVVIPEHEIMGDLVRKLNEVIRRLNTISHE